MKVDFNKLERAFNPKCLVVVGDKRSSNYMWLRGQKNFIGKLYSVQIDPDDIRGIKELGVPNYSSLMDIPEPIDLVIVAVPRAIAPAVLKDCIAKDVAAAQFFTSGFTETATKEGIEMESRLVKMAEDANFHLIGPNCVGIFNPRLGVRQNAEQYTGIEGSVGFISQSGAHATNFSREGHFMGVDIKESVSFGNGVVLDSVDFLEYFAANPEIKVIGMYLEGIKDGRRFFEVLRKVTADKPVVIWKGGRTEEGERAISSHTGSLAMQQVIWDAVVRQCGAIKVTGQDEMIDTMQALLYLEPVKGDRVGIAGGSGGQSVALADIFAEAGLSVPPLSQQSYDELLTFFSLIGGGFRNPIDTGNPNRLQMKRIMEILEDDANVDNLVLSITARMGTAEQLENDITIMSELRSRTSKPLMVILSTSFAPGAVKQSGDIIGKLQDSGLPVFVTPERGAQALHNVFSYFKNQRDD